MSDDDDYEIDATGARRKKQTAEQPQPTPPSVVITEEEIKQIETLSHAELVEIVLRYARQCGLAPCQTPKQTAQAMRDELAAIALRPLVAGLNLRADIDNKIKAIEKWLDREEGKAIQRIDQKIQNVDRNAGEMTNEELLIELRKIPQLPGGIKLLENGKLEVTDADWIEVKA